MAAAYLNAISSLSQKREESISDYMQRARLLILKTHPNLTHPDRERSFVTCFLLNLYDQQLAVSIAMVKILTAADSERFAVEGEAVCRYQRPRSFNINFLHNGAFVDDMEDSPGADITPFD